MRTYAGNAAVLEQQRSKLSFVKENSPTAVQQKTCMLGSKSGRISAVSRRVLDSVSLACVVASALVCAGCDARPEGVASDTRSAERGAVREIHLADGTRCAVFEGNYRPGGISCDWVSTRAPQRTNAVASD